MSVKHVEELVASFERVAFDAAETGGLPLHLMAQMSSAISLKRIADALWGTEDTTGLLETVKYNGS